MYIDDIIFGTTKQSLSKNSSKLLRLKFTSPNSSLRLMNITFFGLDFV